MRADNTLFATDNVDSSKQPRYVVSIDFDGTLQHITSHGDIANVPAALPILQNALLGISATSQTLNPDRANATIGSMAFDVVDLANAFTNLVRTQLTTNSIGLRGRTVQFFVGYKSEQDGAGILDATSTDDNPDFDNFVLFQTQVVQTVETKEGKYSIQCADIQRQTKRQIFDLALTYLTSSITDSATTIPVLDLSGFEPNNHGTSYTDAPSSNVIYIRIDQTKEIIRCPFSGIVGNSFTGVTRGVFGTQAKAVEVDPAQLSDRRPKVEEYVYLELPAVKAAYAILTGVIEGTADVLPSSWHAGVATSFVRLTDFKTIGDDLWVPTDDTAGIILRFDGIDKQDAKKFLETEIYLLLGLFSPVYADGQLGLKRMVPSLSDSPFQFDIDDTNVIGSGNLRHDMESMQNNMRVDWNWNGDRFIRSTIIVDASSIAKHGQAPEKRMSFRGLVGTRFTEQVLRQLLTSLRDMYTGPPLRLDINGFHLMNPLEVGDACRVNLSNIRDYSQTGGNLVRTMVIHGMTVDWLKGVKLKMFGSSERADEIPPITATTCLPDTFYPSVGTALSTIPGLLTGNVTNAGTFTLVGDADMNAAGAIFYHDAPLTISSTTTINIEQNVQLRVRGFLTIDGSIIGTGQGHVAGTDNFLFDQHYYFRTNENVGVPGFIGNSISHHGLLFREPDDGGIPKWVWVTGPYFTQGLYDAFPNLVLEVDDAAPGTIIGIPTDMRGGGGAAGPRAGLKIGISGRTHMKNAGGAGGAGGAALAVICRGGDFGVSGVIRLDGADSTEPIGFFISAPSPTFHIYGGAGGAGCPGALLWLIDGSAQTFPDIAGHFFALTGNVPAQFALPFQTQYGQNRSLSNTNAPQKNMAPFMPNRISGFDQTGVNFRISFLPCDVVPQDDQDVIVPPPTGLAAAKAPDGVLLTWSNPVAGQFDHIEIHSADTNVRANAVIVGETKAETFIHPADYKALILRFYWIRAVDAEGNVSTFEPDTSTTTATNEPLRERKNWLVDPDFDIGNPVPNWSGNGNGSQTDIWRANITGGGTADHVPGGGQDGSVAIDLFQNNDTGLTSLENKKKVSFKGSSGAFLFQIKYRTEGSIDALDHDNFSVGIKVSEFEFGGVVTTFVLSPRVTLTRSATFKTVELVHDFATSSNINWIGFEIRIGNDQGTLDKLRIDSVQVSSLGTAFGQVKFNSKTYPGVVPIAQAADQGLFLKGDGTWGTPSGAGVDSFNGRTGAVIPIQADYDGFFLTPAEGDATYSMLGHLHDGIADANLVDKTAAETITGAYTMTGGLTLTTGNLVAGTINADFAALTATTYGGILEGNLVNLAAAELITGLWNFNAEIDHFAPLLIWNAGQTDNLRMAHTGTNFTFDFTGTADGIWTAARMVMPASVAGRSGFNIPEGVNPTTPIDGDIWVTTTDIFARINGVNESLKGGGGGAVTSVFGRTGVVVALQADYDGFFLTPAEGDATYSMLGHLHDGIADANLVDKTAAEIITAIWDFNATTLGTGDTTAARIKHHFAGLVDIGMNLMPVGPGEDANDVLEAGHCGAAYLKDGTATITLTLEASASVDFPVGGMCMIINAGTSGNISVTEGTGTTLFVLSGASKIDSAGTATIGPGGYATLWREATTIYYLMGAGVTP